MLTTSEIAVTASIWVLTAAGAFFGIRGKLRNRQKKLSSKSNTTPLAFMLIMLAPLPTLAAPAITCHCFTERTFNPTRPAAADPYFLATTQNSFFAAVFAADKKAVVMKKQNGTSSDDLWIAYWIAGKNAASPDALLLSKRDKSWRDVIAANGLTEKSLGSRFSAAMSGKATSARLAEAVVDELCLQYRLLGENDLAALRKTGATNQDVILVAMIAGKSRQSAIQVYRDIRSGSKSWGGVLEQAHINPAESQKFFMERIGRS